MILGREGLAHVTLLLYGANNLLLKLHELVKDSSVSRFGVCQKPDRSIFRFALQKTTFFCRHNTRQHLVKVTGQLK